MDKYERRIFIIAGVMLVVFLAAMMRAVSKGLSDLPACIPYDPSYLEPRVTALDENTYQVFMVAQMWSFQPSEVFIPVGAEVDFYLTTKDVVHGFHISGKNVNMMAVYGGINKTTVKFDEPGIYPIVCHEYCGSGHQHMKADVIVNYPNK
jgi:cytochrome c oxidase subunit 2